MTSADLRRTLLHAALATAADFCELNFVLASQAADSQGHDERHLLKHAVAAYFPQADCVVTLAWCRAKQWASSAGQVAGTVWFATVTGSGFVKLMSVQLLPQEDSLESRTEHHCSKQLPALVNQAPHALMLVVSRDGGFQLEVGGIFAIQRQASASAASFAPEVSLWVAHAQGSTWEALPTNAMPGSVALGVAADAVQKLYSNAHSAGLSCLPAHPVGYEATISSTIAGGASASASPAVETIGESLMQRMCDPSPLSFANRSRVSAGSSGISSAGRRLPLGSLSFSSAEHTELSMVSPFRLTPCAAAGAGSARSTPVSVLPAVVQLNLSLASALWSPIDRPSSGEDASPVAFRTLGSHGLPANSSLSDGSSQAAARSPASSAMTQLSPHGTSSFLASGTAASGNFFSISSRVAVGVTSPMRMDSHTWPGRNEKPFQPFQRPMTWHAGDCDL